ncbi:hypothetical protein [Bifidobacterium choerinum]|uniref:hypothetical protein n=1 Tax=Bifidobacterium choerinum TaxID=35760 RepID=UPI00138AC257|nr:hypothetical protein [Bifidobacterium choerinum]
MRSFDGVVFRDFLVERLVRFGKRRLELHKRLSVDSSVMEQRPEIELTDKVCIPGQSLFRKIGDHSGHPLHHLHIVADSGQSGRRIPPSIVCDVARRGGLLLHLFDG